ncbi:6-bladed beta-propeller [Gemmatimonadota bacterium]
MTSFRKVLISCTTLALLAACSSGPGTARHSFRIYQEDGVTIAETSGGPRFDGPLFEYTEVLRLEQDESIEESLLFRVSEYYLGDDGNYYVNDRGNGRFTVFGPDGKYLHGFGRTGEGPGEYRRPGILWIRDNQMVVYDSRLYRISRLTLDGRLLETIPRPVTNAQEMELYPVSDTSLLQITRRAERPSRTEEIRTHSASIRLRDTDSSREIASFTETRRWVIVGGAIGSQPIFYSRTPQMLYQPDLGVLCSTGQSDEFQLYSTEGELYRTVRLRLEPERVTGGERDAIRRHMDDLIEQASDDRERALYREVKQQVHIPEVKPAWMRLIVDDQGYCWLHEHDDLTVEEPWTLQPSFKVLSPDGEYLGKTEWPVRFPSAKVSRGHLLTMQENQESGEIEYIIYRLEPAVRRFNYPD